MISLICCDLRLIYLVVCEISHQSILNVGVVCDTTQNLGTLEGSFWIGAAVVQIPERDNHISLLSSTNEAFKNNTFPLI